MFDYCFAPLLCLLINSIFIKPASQTFFFFFNNGEVHRALLLAFLLVQFSIVSSSSPPHSSQTPSPHPTADSPSPKTPSPIPFLHLLQTLQLTHHILLHLRRHRNHLRLNLRQPTTHPQLLFQHRRIQKTSTTTTSDGEGAKNAFGEMSMAKNVDIILGMIVG
ncbi:unnamed protein product [Prunus armeniaca]|uniref:Uncharacterized protein n=1 Tax=Prunus armeniaca TaxID=36596 RepID=A0A6J5WTC7_PRUAR|nr:unnamed protein product [Prunus armeniaca]CAB4303641.1 unnamed protein product [Prunus armeniaca]